MKKILISFFVLIFLLSFSKNSYAATNCSFRFLDSSALREDLPKENGTTIIGPTEAFYVLIYNLNSSTNYRIQGLDSKGIQFTDGGGEKPSEKANNVFQAVFGPINNGGSMAVGIYTVNAYESSTKGDGSLCGTSTFAVKGSSTTNPGTCELQPRAINNCSDGYAALPQPTTDWLLCICVPKDTPGVLQNFNKATPEPTSPPPPPPPCEKGFDVKGNPTTDPTKITSCSDINTALGIFSTDPGEFVKTIFGIVLSLAGGIAILLIIFSGYGLMFSQGNPEKVQAAREQLTAAIVGLLFIIFSMSILQIIGVDILNIPGLTR